jgi:hypothetical protein
MWRRPRLRPPAPPGCGMAKSGPHPPAWGLLSANVVECRQRRVDGLPV